MESNEVLRELDRAAAVPFLTYPETPVWYPPLVGACFAGIVGGAALVVEGRPAAGLAVEVLALVCLGIFAGWYRRKWGTSPDLRQAPPELRSAHRRFWAGALLVLAVSAATCRLGGVAVGAVVAFVTCTAAVWWYERRGYPAACARVRARLA